MKLSDVKATGVPPRDPMKLPNGSWKAAVETPDGIHVVTGPLKNVEARVSALETKAKALEKIGSYSNFGAGTAPTGGGKYKTKRIIKNKYRNTKRLRGSR
jgi:hypothetical protein